mgnify:CR=1 FL=1
MILVQYKQDAEKIFESVGRRLNKFGLELATEKTRLIEFGRYAEINARERAANQPYLTFLDLRTLAIEQEMDGLKSAEERRRKDLTSVLEK